MVFVQLRTPTPKKQQRNCQMYDDILKQNEESLLHCKKVISSAREEDSNF